MFGKTLLIPVGLCTVAFVVPIARSGEPPAKTPPPRSVIRDLIWVWGNPELTTDGPHTLATFREASPTERARMLGVPNIVMAGSGLPNDDEHAERLTQQVDWARRLVWETTPDGAGIGPPFVYKQRMSQIRALAEQFPRIEGVLLDDMSTGKMDRGFKPEHIRHIRHELGGLHQSVKIWGVVYSMSLGRDRIDEYLKELDVINLWVWHAKDLVKLEKYVANCESRFPGKPIVVGLYLYDYGEGRRMPIELLEKQCETALKLAHAGRIQGMVFLTINNDEKAVKWAADWIKRVGSQTLRPPAAQLPSSGRTSSHKLAADWPSWIEGAGESVLRATDRDGKIHIETSGDAGKTWAPLSVIARSEGVLSGGTFSRLSNVSLLLTTFEASKRVSWVRSDDHGRTWSKPTLIMERDRGWHGYGPIVVMRDGRWAYCPYYEETIDGVRKFQAFVVWSGDQGKTWGEPIAFPIPEDGNRGLTEATLVQLAPDNYVAAIRSDEVAGTEDAFDGFYLSWSKDGLNWSPPVSLGERGRMPRFYRVDDMWTLAYRLYDCAKATQYGAFRFSQDGAGWSRPLIVESGVNAGPQLVRVNGQLVSFNNRYPDRRVGTRTVFVIPDWILDGAMMNVSRKRMNEEPIPQ